ncbi:hypothetical protein HPB48_020301 [Haemaphysalis longicornis]|uniref:Uncharacterized protein n=1 Tax=Haemaphysalis longicornis TaxID=44386 RepID=A0A9J6GMC8_HAELO|nr:hypothetical protein HPB48_020301 [Haemaphysalis longicornis]
MKRWKPATTKTPPYLRRKTQQLLRPGFSLPAAPSADGTSDCLPLNRSWPKRRRSPPRQPPLPVEYLELAFRPRNGHRLARVSPEKLLMAIATELKLPAGAVNIKMPVDGDQNVLCREYPM